MDLVDKLELTHEGEHPLAVEEWLASCVLERIADPRAVCRLALVNKNLSAASVSDLVWQKLLPPSAILDPLLAHVDYKPLSKKHLYIYLCKSITYEEGLKKFWLDPTTGGECHMISAQALSIIWGYSPQYWQWKPGSMFSKAAYLCWFEVKGTFRHLFRPGWYMISFRLLKLYSKNDWDRVPIKLSIQNTTYAQPPNESQVFFDSSSFKIRYCPLSNMFATSPKQDTFDRESLIYPCCNNTSSKRVSEREEIQDNIKVVHASSSKDLHIWGEWDVGEFFVEDDTQNHPIEVNFSMKEVEVGLWKRGLFFDGVIIRPSYAINETERELSI